MTMRSDRVLLAPCACEPAETHDEFRSSVDLFHVSYTHCEAALAPCRAARGNALTEYRAKSIHYDPRPIVDRQMVDRGCHIVSDIGRG